MTYAKDHIFVIPIYLRPDTVVRVHLPGDLTKAEAEKVSNIVKALVAFRDGEQGET